MAIQAPAMSGAAAQALQQVASNPSGGAAVASSVATAVAQSKPAVSSVDQTALVPTTPVSESQLQKTLEELRKAIQPKVADTLQFSIDNDSGRSVVTVLDTQTNAVIRQIPSEEMLELAKDLDRMQGLLVRQQA